MKPYLIQNAKFNFRDYKQGLDSILSFNYMGSAEFEYGSLPKSLAEIRKRITEYETTPLDILDKQVFVYCRADQLDSIQEVLEKLAIDDYSLKERCTFSNWIWDQGTRDDDFWWDIDNHWMFFRWDLEFHRRFLELIKG